MKTKVYFILLFIFIIFNKFVIKSEESGNFTEKEKKLLLAEKEKNMKIGYGDIVLSENELYKRYENEKAISNKIDHNGYNYIFFIFDLPSYGISKKKMEGWYSYSKDGKWIKFVDYNIYNKDKIRGVADKKMGNILFLRLYMNLTKKRK